MKSLPKSDEFPDEADVNLIPKEELLPVKCGDFIQKGQTVICRQCPNNHTIPGAELTIEGKLVKRKR